MKYLYHATAISAQKRFSARMRARRMEKFLAEMQIRGGERVVDLGGVPAFWNACPHPLKITSINLPGEHVPVPADTHHEFTMVEGDACDVDFAEDMSFDLAFSNSVIEHVGGPENEARMAAEARRLAPRYWVQTPSIWFPIEAHTYLPFWWFYPQFIKDRFMRRWQEVLPARSEMLAATTVVSAKALREMFPDGTLWTEWVAGFPKSYVMYRTS